MEKLNSEDGQLFIKNLASFVRTHEKALANALQLRRQSSKNGPSTGATSSTLAAALSFGPLKFTSHTVKSAKLTLTPHHLFYLLSRFEELFIPVGPMNVRLENIHTETAPSYVSFLNQPRRSRGDRDSIHSVSSVRSVISGMSALWSSFGLGSKDASKSEKAKAALEADLKYLYSAFTKIPCLRLAPDHRARLIRGYEEFPLDTAVPLHCFKNVSSLEIIDIDFRSFYGWDRLSEQLRTLTLKRANIDDPADLLTRIVLDDIDKRRRRSSKSQPSPVLGSSSSATHPPPDYKSDMGKSNSAPGSPTADSGLGTSTSPKAVPMVRGASEGGRGHRRSGSYSPTRPQSSKQVGYRHSRGHSVKIARSGSGSSNSSEASTSYGNRSSSNLLAGVLPPTKWRFLRHLGLPDNSLTSITASSLAPVANTLHSLDLSSNHFGEVPDSLASLVSLRALNLSNCMIESLRSLSKNPLPAITALNLRGNRLSSLAGIERLLSLERLDLRDNNLSDPTEIARLTGLPEIREIWVSGNPFTKTHSGYRVTIFNLFRRTPGYAEDIIIDASGPGYSERKQLVDRVAEPEAAPVVRPVDPEPPQTVSRASGSVRHGLPPNDQEPPVSESLAPESQQNNYTVGSSRRKKALRRRIVDISREDSAAAGDKAARVEATKHTLTPAPGPTDPSDPFIETSTQGMSPRTVPQLATPEPVKRQVPYPVEANNNRELLPAIQDLDWNVDGNVYRQRLEALKQDVGSGWLSVLGDDAWQPKQQSIAVPCSGPGLDSPTIRPDPITRTPNQVMVSGGRTLG
ncbi:Leucine Rich Repeat domain protein [Rasamsonia emersonii CBS 393.64]|uniref:Leucine Rich Repeat domain protein n=1 Tax=Rasamsonia emersonii (strain ATCC 16479 / CBS 393.64 / IMI 116815) TaxID=1408163 RepID=A0A0F4Z3W3_RASE3|nr:Leucine Rich Repeat domain protein [Rasamsonia emersonii CBS 393.64]KKA25040.1 Leucine Rich Repeat domain protein [Rasamsonia emersonii CBS 393.64]